MRGAAPATADDPIQLSISVAGLLQIVNIVRDMGATGASLGAGVGDWTAGWNAAVDGPAMGRAGSRLAPRVSLWSPAPRRVGGKISPRGRIIRSSGNIATIFWPSPTRLATHTPVMSDFRPHDQESAWEFIGIGAAVFVFAIVALGWRTALRWCGDCALDRRARRERLQEEEALRLTRTLLPTHGDESYGSSSNATVIELVVDGGTPHVRAHTRRHGHHDERRRPPRRFDKHRSDKRTLTAYVLCNTRDTVLHHLYSRFVFTARPPPAPIPTSLSTELAVSLAR